jgi:hypothetical protein
LPLSFHTPFRPFYCALWPSVPGVILTIVPLYRQDEKTVSKHISKKFCLNHAVYFQNLSEPPNGERLLPAIQITFDELESLKKTLEFLAESCAEFAQDVSLDLLITSLFYFIFLPKLCIAQSLTFEVGNLQHMIAEDNKGLALIMMVRF